MPARLKAPVDRDGAVPGARAAWRAFDLSLLFAVTAGVLALVVLLIVDAPLAGATNDTDSAASVLYFQHLVAGQRLEAFVPTTPKPLLTVVYGLAWAATHDWRTLTLLTVVVGATAVALAARLAWLLAGPAAAAAAATALVAWPAFGLEVARANSFVWALCLCLLASVLMAGERPRPWAAGSALALAALARPEALWLVGAAGVAVVARATPRLLRRPTESERDLMPLLLGGLALPAMCVHDWLLTGDPLYWLSVPAGYTALVYPHLARIGLHAWVTITWMRYEPVLPVLVLGAAGLAVLAARRRPGFSLALAASAAGVLATLALLGLRRIYISDRYYEELDAPLLIAAAIGAGGLLGEVAGRGRAWLAGRGSAARTDATDHVPPDAGVRSGVEKQSGALLSMLLVVAGCLAGVLLGTPRAAEPAPDQQLASSRAADSGLRAVSSDLARIAGATQGSTVVVPGVSYPVADALQSSVYVPRSLLPRIAVETGARIPQLGDSYLGFRGSADSLSIEPGQWVLHIAAADGAGGAFSRFEGALPSVVDGAAGRPVRLVPKLADRAAGVWLFQVEALPAE